MADAMKNVEMKVAAVVAFTLWVIMVVGLSFASESPLASRTVCSDLSPVCIDLRDKCSGPDHVVLRLACPVTCASCADQPNLVCADTRSECERIASAGRCDARPLTFWRDCPLSCGVCSLSAAVGNQANHEPAELEGPMSDSHRAGDGCLDTRLDCQERADAGACSDPPSRPWMVVACARACGTCQQRQERSLVVASRSRRARSRAIDSANGADAANSRGGAESAGTHSSEARDEEAAAGAASDGAAGRGEPSGGAIRCRDLRRACNYWVSAGECEREGAQDAMHALCPAACGFCQPSAAQLQAPRLERVNCASSEADRHDSCEDWAAAGECERGAALMHQVCACACRQPYLREMAALALARGLSTLQGAKAAPEVSGGGNGVGGSGGGGGGDGGVGALGGTDGGGGGCADQHERCAGWALIGLCGSTPIPMRRLCPLSCGRCPADVRLRRAIQLEESDDSERLAASTAANTRADAEGDGDGDGGGGGDDDDSDGDGRPIPPQLHRRLEEWCAEHAPERNVAQRLGKEQGPRSRDQAQHPSPTSRGQRARARTPLPPQHALMRVPLANVRLSAGSEFYAAQQLNSHYLLSLPVDRLLWSFRRVAGLPTPGDPYSAWEAAEGGGYPDPQTPTRTLRGHFVGHLLSALALGYAASGEAKLAARALELTAELARCQHAIGSGFVSAWPSIVLDTLEQGDFSKVQEGGMS